MNLWARSSMLCSVRALKSDSLSSSASNLAVFSLLMHRTARCTRLPQTKQCEKVVSMSKVPTIARILRTRVLSHRRSTIEPSNQTSFVCPRTEASLVWQFRRNRYNLYLMANTIYSMLPKLTMWLALVQWIIVWSVRASTLRVCSVESSN